jgi:cyclase
MIKQIMDNVWVELGVRGCNHGFVTTGDGVVMIDTPYKPSDAIRWREEIAKWGEVCYIINTEPHADHCIGNAFFSGTVIAQEGTRAGFAAVPMEDIRRRVGEIDPESLPLMKDYRPKLPAVTFGDRLSLYVGDCTFELIHLPGHTLSQTAVYMPREKVLFTGDNVVFRVQGHFYQAHPDRWLRSLERIGEMDVRTIVPGHGEVCDKSYLPEMAAFVGDWVAAVRGAIDRGLSREEAMAEISFLSRYPMSGGSEAMGPEVQRQNVARIYDLISQGEL